MLSIEIEMCNAKGRQQTKLTRAKLLLKKLGLIQLKFWLFIQ
jgi:hypothetical protein